MSAAPEPFTSHAGQAALIRIISCECEEIYCLMAIFGLSWRSVQRFWSDFGMKISVPFCGAAWYNDPEGFDFVCTSVLHDNERLFMSKYLTCLPTKEQLRTEI